MLVQNKKGNLSQFDSGDKTIDWLPVEWYEAGKRILRKQTLAGIEVAIQFLNENAGLTEGDILFIDEALVIAVSVIPCDCIVVKPRNMFEVASVCYEIGNKHLPLFYEDETLLIPLDIPLSRLLCRQGYDIKEEPRKLLHPLKTTVAAHELTGNIALSAEFLKAVTPDR